MRSRVYLTAILKIGFIALLLTNSTGIVATQNTQISSHNVKITATMNYLGDFAKALLGDHGIISSVVSGSVDPHFFEPSASDLINLQEADVILGIGHEEIDSWLTDFIKDNPDLKSKVFNVADLETVLEYDPIINSKNPHFWLSPVNALLMVENIKNHFENLELIEKSILDANFAKYETVIKSLLSEIELKSSIYNGTKVVVDHPAFFYFLNLVGFERMGAIEEREGVDPSPLHIQDLTNLMNKEDINLIIASKTQAGSDVDQLASNTGAKIILLTPLPGIEGAENYTQMMRYNINSLDNPVEPTKQDELNFQLVFITYTLIAIVLLRKMLTKYRIR